MLSLTCLSFIGLLSIASIAIVARDLSQTQLAGDLLTRLELQYAMPGAEATLFTRVVDLVQSEFQCCGVSGPGDYQHTAWQTGRDHSDPDHQLRLPLTCCSLADHGAQAFLEPSPLNTTLCQTDLQGGRFKHSQVSNSRETKLTQSNRSFQGCKSQLERFVSQQLVIIVGMCLGASAANIVVLSVMAFFWKNISSSA